MIGTRRFQPLLDLLGKQEPTEDALADGDLGDVLALADGGVESVPPGSDADGLRADKPEVQTLLEQNRSVREVNSTR